MIDRDIASHSGGRYIVRVEDTDQAREVEGALAQFDRAFAHFRVTPDEYGAGDGVVMCSCAVGLCAERSSDPGRGLGTLRGEDLEGVVVQRARRVAGQLLDIAGHPGEDVCPDEDEQVHHVVDPGVRAAGSGEVGSVLLEVGVDVADRTP
jgi:hypothetical protein